MEKAPEGFRPLGESERAIINRLLEEPFIGRDEIRMQLEGACVRPWAECAQHCASVEFAIQGDHPLPRETVMPVPVSAMASDTDGLPIEILLFCRDGKLHDLEFVVFGERMIRMPRPDELDVVIAPPMHRRHARE